MSRFNAKIRCNYYPLPLSEAERIRNLLRFPTGPPPHCDKTHNLAVLNPYPCRWCPRNLLIYGPPSGPPVLALNP
jgi:hypothetical protein